MSHCYVTLPFHKLFHIYHHTHIYHPIIYIHIYIWYHIYMHHITSWIMQLWSPTICCQQAGKSRVSGIIQSGSKGLRSKEIKGLSLSQKAKECGIDGISPGLSQKVQEPVVPVFKGTRRLMSQVKQRVNSPFPCTFVLFRPSGDWMGPTCIGEGNLLYSGYQVNCSSPQETLSQTWK